ncbi:glycoside hydrolase family 28 protein [Pseudopedobacter beijingensis]|uniref:Glycoside hydrolase family 28 protein n=1 Tax=Pseudopedobacter beijingensis TaxID=1207056 RepID=A0ABW4I854_9SPHI
MKVPLSLIGLVALNIFTSRSFAGNLIEERADSVLFEKTFNVRLPKIATPVFKKDTFYVEKFGAKPDGITLNTKSINAAIEACSKNGGGVVFLGGGVWLTGPIKMQSNVNLHIKRDAILQFTKDKNEYKLIEGNWEGKPAVVNESPISAFNVENIAITGEGIVDGNGDAWRLVKRGKMTDSQWKKLVASGGVLSADGKSWMPSQSYKNGDLSKDARTMQPGSKPSDYASMKDFYRPNLLVIANSKKILLEGVTFQNSPAWCLHPLMSEDLVLRNVFVKNPWYAQNGDGIDIESCKNVLIENSTFDVGDDGICIKSGRDEPGRKRGMPTQNVIVRNNIVYHAHGGFVIGSEMSGGAKNLYVYNNSFIGTDIGLRFKTTRGRGGVVENVYIANSYMKDIPGEAILFDMYYEAKDPIPLAGEKRPAPVAEFKPVSETTPQFKDFYIKNVVCNGADKGLFVRGIPEMNVKNIFIEDAILEAKTGIEIIEGTNINLKNVRLITQGNNPLIFIENSKKVNIDGLKSDKKEPMLISISGDRSGDLVLKNSEITPSKDKVEFNYGAKASILKTK